MFEFKYLIRIFSNFEDKEMNPNIIACAVAWQIESLEEFKGLHKKFKTTYGISAAYTQNKIRN